MEGSNFAFLSHGHEYDIICSVGTSRAFLTVFSFRTAGGSPFPSPQRFLKPQVIPVGDVFRPWRRVLLSMFSESLLGLSFSEAPPPPPSTGSASLSIFFLLFPVWDDFKL